MKIEKLYTLSQFVELMEEYYPIAEPDTGEEFQFLVVRYNEFLKQSLEKEMFVNGVKKPLICYSGDMPVNIMKAYDRQMENWNKAEKKVLFNSSIRSVGFGSSEIKIKKTRIGYIKDNEFICNYETLSELAEATNGKLMLKNTEL